MQLLIQRGQRKTKILQRPIFNLWAKFELTTEEASLIDRYHVRNHILVEGDPRELKRAMIIAGVIAVILVPLLGLQYSLGIFVVGTYLIYHQIREQIRVSDILDGRFFACRSVVTLMAKEQDVAGMANAFRHLLEAMKNWGGKEIIELKPYEAPALRVIEPPHAAA